MNEKITRDHLQRFAYVYVRQSSMHQVRHHQESRQRQYALTTRARELGFAQTIVIDEDQGKSGTGLQHRPGFGQLLAVVCEGKAGAVFALEASRLARNNRDWYHLIDLCALTATLIVDAEGVYDPRHLNDRLLLGLKGSMAEFELGLLRQRARQAYEQKIARGHALWEVSVGFVRDEDDRIQKIADRQVQQAIESVFSKFRELGSARQTMLWFRDERIVLPEVVPGTRGREIVWRLPTEGRIRQVIRNAVYAGALAYGKTAFKTVVENGHARRASTRQHKPRENWKNLILDDHPGYISWSDYLRNLEILESNRAMSGGTGQGAARRGPALLAGLLRCGHCGRKLTVGYCGRGGRLPRYVCNGGRTHCGSAACMSFGGVNVERAVVEQVLDALRPEGIAASLCAAEQSAQAQATKRQSLQLALEKARYEVRRCQRQYDAVDPDNRLVAGELEARWNDALERVRQLEQQLEVECSEKEFTDTERDRLQDLGHDLPALWSHPQAPDVLKKRILRTVLHEIVVTDTTDKSSHILRLHWQGGVHTELRVPRNTTGRRRTVVKKTTLELISELSKVCNDQAIAATLNRLGRHTSNGTAWRVHSVRNSRYYYRLPNHRNDDQWLTIERSAKVLEVSHTVIRRLIRENTLPATQVVPGAPWIIARDALSLPAVVSAVHAVRHGRQLPPVSANQRPLPFKSRPISKV
jgi:DNA invertase Pin-like site-specific DNA recombinase